MITPGLKKFIESNAMSLATAGQDIFNTY
jgi:hypothetical protein